MLKKCNWKLLFVIKIKDFCFLRLVYNNLGKLSAIQAERRGKHTCKPHLKQIEIVENKIPAFPRRSF